MNSINHGSNNSFNESQEISSEKGYFSKFEFDDNILISDKFYRHSRIKYDKYSARAKTHSFFKPIDRASKALDEMKEMHIQNVPSKMLDRKRRSIYRSLDGDLNNLEEMLNIDDLKTFQRHFLDAIKEKQATLQQDKDFQLTTKNKLNFECLNKEEFVKSFTGYALFPYFEADFSILFDRLDTKDAGLINWNDFCTHYILRQREKEFLESLKPIPFNNKMKIRHSRHNQLEVTVKFLLMENPNRFINITRHGSIGLWSKNLIFQKSYQISDEVESSIYINKTKKFSKKTYTLIVDHGRCHIS